MQRAETHAKNERPLKTAIMRALERLAVRESARKSGVYDVVDEFAGLDRLDRAELDETDE